MNKALIGKACAAVADHFADVSQMIELGKGTKQ
jgi:hypothetical protein